MIKKTETKKKVDPERLRTAIKKRGMKISEAGVKCGKCDNFISNFCRRGELLASNIPILEKCLGIPYEEYCPIPKKNDVNTGKVFDNLLSIITDHGIEIDFEIKGHISGRKK